MFICVRVYLECWKLLCGDQNASAFPMEFWDSTSQLNITASFQISTYADYSLSLSFSLSLSLSVSLVRQNKTFKLTASLNDLNESIY
jgi:hypothetical protein